LRADRRQRGFTLIEMLVSLAILSLAVGALAPLLLDSSRVNRAQQMTMAVQADARNSLELVTNALRTAGWDPLKTGFAALALNASDPASADHIEIFADLNEDGDTADDGEDVLIRLNGNRLEWRKSTGGSFVVLADGITNDENGDGTAELMFTPNSATAPTQVAVKITARSPVPDPRTGQYIRYTVSDLVALRGSL
jgi:prepilin-type N-terminal cleavage/methylation domain-containing protein